MIIQTIAFYAFAAVTVVSAFMVIAARNPVHSVLYLILAFFNSAALFLLLGAEFIAMILIIVYVGAVAVLFLFVVMMLDINLAELRQGFLRYLPIGAAVGLVLFAELMLALGVWVVSPTAAGSIAANQAALARTSNTEAIGKVLYTDYFFLFQAAGVVLLVAMIGAIVLTLRQRAGVRRQKIAEQIARTRDEAVTVVKVPVGGGI
ncbi:MAG: NADH-quinone oxidoreductase subunit J [Alphaproteobacteria bacterium]|nr:NADH-quinone oxidoreductase subunit J [Alphaproteobacteria bacterium]MCW5740140.1 NADH-quinone oxidoreductase subunit J [Alphaproteobacteria bacterium]